MISVVSWIKHNYKDLVFLISLLCCFLSVISKQKLFFWLLICCLIKQIVIFLWIIYEIITKRQIRENLFQIFKLSATLFLSTYFLLTMYYGYQYNKEVLLSGAAFFSFVFAFVPRKGKQKWANMSKTYLLIVDICFNQ